MKCPHCQTFVAKIPLNWKCPHCGEKLPEPGYWFRFFEGLTEYLLEKGAIFWGTVLGTLLIIIGLVEIIFSDGYLLSYISGSVLFSIIMIFYGGMLIDMYMKVVLPLRVRYGSDFIIRERAVIRNFRKGTHIALITGLLVSLLWAGPQAFWEYFPSYLIIIGWFLAFAWAIGGLFLDPRLIDDVRFRNYLDRLGITSLKRLRKIGTMVIGALVLVCITYFVLTSIPRLPQKISNMSIIGDIITFVNTYLSWLL
ncbi:MAG: zinc ribbon domain-containing protein [Calditrichota bacterium]